MKGQTATRSSFGVLVLVVAGLGAGLLVPGGAEASPGTPGTTATPKAPVRQLREVGNRRTPGGRIFRYRQIVDGVPVLGGEAVLTDLPGADDLLVDSTRAGVDQPPSPRVGRAEALETARARTGTAVLRGRPRATLAILPTGRAEQLVWKVLLPARRPLASFEVLVDALSGETLRVRDLLRRAQGTANLYDTNPVVARGSADGLGDNADADSPALTAARSPVSLPRLRDDSNCLVGRWAHATLPTGEVCTAARDFSSVTRSDDRFEALMAYFHADRTRAYIQDLGFGGLLDRPTRLRANDFPDDNAFYDPATREISLGTGGVDDGEDGEVVVHEYGHAIQDAQVPGFGAGREAGAMGEGFADYLAARMAATYAPSQRYDPCLAEWDVASQVPRPDCMRRTDRDLTVAAVGPGTPCGGEVHCAGEVWAGALWELRGAMGGPETDRLVIQSHASLTSNATFQDGSRALLAADRALNAGGRRGLLTQVLIRRGLLDPERLDDTIGDAADLVPPTTVNGRLNASRDAHDVFRVPIDSGAGIVVRLSGDSGDMNLRLYRPGAVAFTDAAAVVAGSTRPGSAEDFAYTARSPGNYALDVSAASGAGGYRLEVLPDRDGDTRADGEDNCPGQANPAQENRDSDAAGDVCDPFPHDPENDLDRDGVGAPLDVCPSIADPAQKDWNANGRGDACDSEARITLNRVRPVRRRVVLQGSVRPSDLVAAREWVVRIEKRGCARGRCRYRPVRSVRGGSRSVTGATRAEVRLSLGRYRARATLRHERLSASPSVVRTFTVRR